MKLSKTMKLTKITAMNLALPVLLYVGLVHGIDGVFNIYKTAIALTAVAMIFVVGIDMIMMLNGKNIPPLEKDVDTPRWFRISLVLYQIAMLSFYGEILLAALYVFIVFMIKFHIGLCDESSSGAEAQDSKRS